EPVILLRALEPLDAAFRRTEDNAVAFVQVVVGRVAEKFRETALILLVIGGFEGLAIKRTEELPVLAEMFARQRKRLLVRIRDVEVIDAQHFAGFGVVPGRRERLPVQIELGLELLVLVIGK